MRTAHNLHSGSGLVPAKYRQGAAYPSRPRTTQSSCAVWTAATEHDGLAEGWEPSAERKPAAVAGRVLHSSSHCSCSA